MRSLSSYQVRFHGSALDRMGRGALSAAGVTIIDRRAAPGWEGQQREYLVSVDAKDSEDAIRRVRSALDRYGSHADFAARAELS